MKLVRKSISDILNYFEIVVFIIVEQPQAICHANARAKRSERAIKSKKLLDFFWLINEKSREILSQAFVDKRGGDNCSGAIALRFDLFH